MIRTILISASWLLLSTVSSAQISIKKMWVNNQVNPIGIVHPLKFSWQLSSEKRNTFQSAFEVQVSSDPSNFKEADLWHSGKIESDQSLHVSYNGKPLTSGSIYFWRVRVWNQDNKVSKWSAPASWQMGLLNPNEEFIANWIVPGFEEDTINRPSPIFRKEFEVANKKIVNATAYITAHGVYEAQINSKRVGEFYMAPGWTITTSVFNIRFMMSPK